jgi:hypothetical protein
LDGVDEALRWHVDPALLAHPPSPLVRIVVSARTLVDDSGPESWAERLGWDADDCKIVSLTALTIDGVHEVLQRVNRASNQVAGDAQVVAELYRLTEGDPLLLRMYVEYLQSHARGASLAGLADFRPGLAGYFKKWREDHERMVGQERAQGARLLLHLLAASLGPMSRDDIQQVAAGQSALDGESLEEALAAIDRLVIGDGKVQGYTLSHPRLANYFWEEVFTDTDRRGWDRRFSDWFDRTEALPTDALPSYVVRWRRPHLERAGAKVQQLAKLVSRRWFEAWTTLDGFHATGFREDVEAVWKALEVTLGAAGTTAEGRDGVLAGEQLRCALCVASVRSMATNIPRGLVKALAESGVWTTSQAFATAQSMAAWRRADAALAIVPLAEDHLRDDIVADILATTREIEDTSWRNRCLVGLVPYLHPRVRESLVGDLMARRCDLPPGQRALIVAGVLAEVAGEKRSELLTEIVEAIRHDDAAAERSAIIARIAPHITSHFVPQVLSIAQLGEHAHPQSPLFYWRTKSIIALIPYLPEPERSKALEIAITDLHRCGAVGLAELLTMLVPIASEAQQAALIDHALHTARTEEKWLRAEILAAAAGYETGAAREGMLRQALEAARASDGSWRTKALLQVAESCQGQARSSVLREALEAARSIDDLPYAAAALLALSGRLTPPSQRALQQRLLALAAGNAVPSFTGRVIEALAPHLHSDLGQRAIEVMSAIRDPGWRAAAMEKLVDHLTADQLLSLDVGSLEGVPRSSGTPSWRRLSRQPARGPSNGRGPSSPSVRGFV